MAFFLFLCLMGFVVASHAAISREFVRFSTGSSGQLEGILLKPHDYSSTSCYPGVVLMHGCSGMYYTGDLQGHIEKWATKLAQSQYVVLALDSFTPRAAENGFGDNPQDEDWQNQCSGKPNFDNVSSYTVRVDDARYGAEYLASLGTVDRARIGLLGWSQGGQTAMIHAAATYKDVDTEKMSHDFAAVVAFYPGCGGALGFGGVSNRARNSFWRPYMEFLLHSGMNDPFYTNCNNRVLKARTLTGHTINFPTYHLACHSFDLKRGKHESEPEGDVFPHYADKGECAEGEEFKCPDLDPTKIRCTSGPTCRSKSSITCDPRSEATKCYRAEYCAMVRADLDTLDYFDKHLKAASSDSCNTRPPVIPLPPAPAISAPPILDDGKQREDPQIETQIEPPAEDSTKASNHRSHHHSEL